MDINMKVVQNKGKSEVILRRSASDIDEDYLEHRLKKQSNFSFHKNLDFLQKHNKLFSKPIYNSGDADTYFRNILRNYDQSDLFKDFNWGRRNFPKTTQSFESLRERSRSKKFSSLIEVKTKKTKSASKLPSGKELKSAKVKKLKKQPKPPSEEPEVEEFYSPGSRTVIDSVGSSFTLLEKDDFPLQEKDEYPLQEKDEYPLQEKVNYISQEKDDLQDNIETEVIEVDNSTAVAKMAEEGADLPDVTDDEEEMSDVEQMIADTEEEMDKMDEENKEIMDQVEGAEMAKADTKAMEGSTFKFDPAIDAAILKELEDAEKQAKEIACIILEIKNRINELLQKEKMTEVEAKELEEKNNELKAQMILFEEETKRIQCLIEQSNLFENMIMPKPPRQVKHAEDMLPKVIVCGMTENDMPKILVCDEKVKRSRCSQRPNPCMAPQMAKKLSDSYTMQQKLASENAGLEGMRYQLQSDLLNKEQTVDQLQKTLSNLQAEMRMICKENASLNERMQQYRQSGANQSSPCGTCGTGSPLGQPQINQYAAPPSGQWGQPPANQWGQPPCMPPQTNQWGQGQPQMPQNMGGNSGCGTPSSAKSKKRCCGQSKPCPVQLENKLNAYNITTLQLEQQITDIENEVTNMQNEVMEVQKAREHLDRHRQMLCCPPPPCGGPCPPPPCGMPCPPPPCGMPCPLPPCGMPCPPPPCGMPCPPPPCGGPCSPPSCPPKHSCSGAYNANRSSGSDQQVREMREKYNRLQDDFKSKLTEVAGLRADNEMLKETTKKAEEARKAAEEKVKDLEKEIKAMKMDQNKFMGSKEQLIEQEQQLIVAKQRFREAQDELEELRGLIEDLQTQLNDYRNKYLMSQQEVEEQKRQIDMMEMENNRVSEQVNLEIQRVKNQFQEKLQELTPLPDILKSTQIKLQEAQQMHILAERNNEALARDLQMYKDKVDAINNQMEQVRSDQQLGEDAKQSLNAKLEEWENRFNELQEEHYKLQSSFDDLEEIANDKEKTIQEKLHEIAQLAAQLESVREESARQVSRTKDRCETIRRSMQNQISDLERQLVQSRAQAKAAQKDRDDIRVKMQQQINNLNDNFDDAQMRIKSLQGHVNFLKTSYNNVFSSAGDAKDSTEVEPCACGVDM